MSPKPSRIYCSQPTFAGNERQYVNDCLDHGWITQGPYVRRFEEELAELCGAKYAVACSSGTAALHLAMLVLGDGCLDVAVPALTYVATANAASYCNHEVLFVDARSGDWCASVDDIIGHEDRGFNGISVYVDLYDSLGGQGACRWDIVDAAHSLGVYRHEARGAHLATFSFYASKTLATGEGGAVVTDDAELDHDLRLYRGQGATTPGRYHHRVIGYNYRMTDLQAAVGLAQLEQLPEFLARRREVIDRYRIRLAGENLIFQGGQRSAGWIMAVLLPREMNRDEVMRRLDVESNIETRPFFDPLPSLPPYAGHGDESDFPVAYDVARRGVCLPTHVALSDNDVDRVCEELVRVMNGMESN